MTGLVVSAAFLLPPRIDFTTFVAVARFPKDAATEAGAVDADTADAGSSSVMLAVEVSFGVGGGEAIRVDEGAFAAKAVVGDLTAEGSLLGNEILADNFDISV